MPNELGVPLDATSYRETASLFATGVTVVTCSGADGSAYGVTVSSFASVSLQPCLVLVCLDNRSSGLDRFLPSQSFVVNILSEDQEALSNYFATQGTDRSISCGHYESDNAETPCLKDCLGWMQCRITQTFPGGDHTILLGEVESVRRGKPADSRGPLLYYRSRYSRLQEDFVSELATAPRSDMETP